jgi:DNA-binding protein H-NS
MPRRPGHKFDAMSMTELLKLRQQIEATLASKRDELQRQMDALSALDIPGASNVRVVKRGRRSHVVARSRRGNRSSHPLKGRSVTPKYRDPENPSQTWAGRGLPPKWLAAYEEQGRKRDEFLIGAAEGAPTKGRRRRRG